MQVQFLQRPAPHKARQKAALFVSLVAALLLFAAGAGADDDSDRVPDKARCPVCGMFVAKFPNWTGVMDLADGKKHYFDGAKDMFAYAFSPEKFDRQKPADIRGMRIRDYYSQKMIDVKTAIYVVGSKVMGPMGAELIPFASREAATGFVRDHQGDKILAFGEITPELVDQLRRGSMMMHHK